ncbi:unnamed protein product [Allacma fusca]|uniref:Uncharacterized protein n=1 Tax=Allacma fusca TaxID=39272 RepID=A0A8J2KYR5_9HEXA|nr:unnamed protein product [Allacma fusca]
MTDEWGAGKWNEDAEMQLDQLNSSSEATNQNPDWLIDRKQIKSRISLGISRRSLFIITTILILGLVAAGIAKNT